MIILLLFAFISGLVTILAPCIWPLLPIILSTSTTGGHRKPLGITIGIMVSFAVFTLSISYLVMIFHFDPNILRLFAVIIIGFLGLSMVIPAFSNVLEGFVSRLTGMLGGLGIIGGRSGFTGGLVTGLSLGIVWSPCAGPILATIATLGATSMVNFQAVLVTIAYVVGVGIPLFVFSYFGSVLFTKSKKISPYTARIQQAFGVVMILTALAIYTNYDKTIQAKLLDLFPSYSSILTSFENNAAVKDQLDVLKGSAKQNVIQNTGQLFNTNYQAPEFVGITKWLNPEKPLTMQELKGKVVLVDFWTYTCINCIRTLPHVTSWYDKYKDKGFVVVGVHTPEFEFEKNTSNVENAIKQFNIHYPVAQDNDYSTWNAFNNQYWPAEYLIDVKGNVRRAHFGEGKYEEMEMAIQALLKEKGTLVSSSIITMPDQTPKTQLSPETYLGSKRMEYFYPNGSTTNVTRTFSLAKNIPENSFSFGGEWMISDEYAFSKKSSVLEYNFTASKVFLVMRPGLNKTAQVKVFLDGKVVETINQGSDVIGGVVTVDSDRLYSLIDLKGKTENHLLRLEFETSGTEIFAFTFG